MNKLWTETVQPALKNAKAKLDIRKLVTSMKDKIIKENTELGRRNALLA